MKTYDKWQKGVDNQKGGFQKVNFKSKSIFSLNLIKSLKTR